MRGVHNHHTNKASISARTHAGFLDKATTGAREMRRACLTCYFLYAVMTSLGGWPCQPRCPICVGQFSSMAFNHLVKAFDCILSFGRSIRNTEDLAQP
jgi:hypothetical protein